MIPLIKLTPLTSLLAFDIETVAAYENVKEENPKMFELFRYKHRNKETEELLSEEETIKLYNKTAALSPIYGKIVCISMGIFDDGGNMKLSSLTGDESEILRKFVDIIKKYKYKLLSFNGIAFDLPYVRQRFMSLGLEKFLTENEGCDVGSKPWILMEKHIDLLAIWKGTRYIPDSLDEVCMTMGVDSPKEGEVKGSNVTKAFYEGKIKEISEYCERDTEALMKLYLKIKYKSI